METSWNDELRTIEECKTLLTSAKGIDRARLYERIGDAYQSMKKQNKSSVFYRSAHEAGLDDIKFLNKFAVSLVRAGRPDEAETLVKLLIERSKSPIDMARSYSTMALTMRMQARIKDAKKTCDEAIGQIPKADPFDPEFLNVRAQVYNTAGLVYWRLLKLDEALKFFEIALESNETGGNTDGVSEILNNMGNVHYHLGDFTTALGFYERSNAIQERPTYHNNIGIIKQALGQFDEAEELFKTAIKKFLMAGMLFQVPQAQINLVEMNIERGEISKAKVWLEMAEKSVKELNAGLKKGDIVFMHSLIALFEKDFISAGRLAAETIEEGKRTDSGLLSFKPLKVLGQVAASRRDLNEVHRCYISCIDSMRKLKLNYELGQAMTEFALVLKSLGAHSEAKKWASEAKELWNKYSNEYELRKLASAGL